MTAQERDRRTFPRSEADDLSGITAEVVVEGDKRTIYDIVVDEEVVGRVRTGKRVIIGRDNVTQKTVLLPWDESFASDTENIPHIPIRDLTKLGGEIGERAKITLRRAKAPKPRVIRKTSK